MNIVLRYIRLYYNIIRIVHIFLAKYL